MTTATLLDVDEATYRALPGLSGTGVKRLLESPADYKYELDHPAPSTPAQALGTLVHALVLGTDVRAIVSPFDSFRTAEAREWKAAQISAGNDIVTADDWYRAGVMRDAVMAHPEARALLDADGSSEVAVTSQHRGAPLKGRIDRLTGGIVMDLKTTRDVSADAMARFMGDYGAATQLAHYGLLVNPEPPRPYIIAVRNTGRPSVAVYRVGEVTWAVALDATKRAWDTYAECLESDVWPDPYATGVHDLDLKPWALDDLDPESDVELSL